MIYIDPPYNTGDDFIYPDNYSMPVEDYLALTGQVNEQGKKLVTNPKSSGAFHTKWLNMMYPRLELAKELLTDDGVIFISIDDNEQANLKLMCDEIFGEENFVGIFNWMKTSTPPSLSKTIRKKLEYILCYQKYNLNNALNGGFVEGGDMPLLNDFNAERTLKFPKDSVFFKIDDGKYKSGNYDRVFLKQDIEIINGKSIKDFELVGRFKWIQDTLDKEILDGTKFYIKSKAFAIRYSREGARIKVPSNILSKTECNVGTNEDAQKDMLKLFSKKVFDYPKPVSLLAYLIRTISYKNDIIIDFFSGSGTTAQGVFFQNSTDKNNRRFLLVQLPENLDNRLQNCTTSEKEVVQNAIELCDEIHKPHFLTEVAKERIRRAGKKIKEEHPDANIDVGFKVFTEGKSNFIPFEKVKGQDEAATNTLFEELEKQITPLEKGWKKEDVLTEVILKSRFALDCDIVKQDAFTNNEVYRIEDSVGVNRKEIVLYVCLDEKIDSDTISKLSLNDKEKFICFDSAIDDTSYARLADKGKIETL